MIDNIPTLSYEEVASIPWEGDGPKFDSQICELGNDYNIFKAINPYFENKELIHLINRVPNTIRCVVWSYQGDWVVKLFKKGWKPAYGYQTIEITLPKITKVINPDIPQLEYNADYTIPYYDLNYEHVWMLDVSLNNNTKPVWAVKLIPEGKTHGIKYRGDVTLPTMTRITNPDLPDLNYNIDYVVPWYDLCYEHVWTLDKSVCSTSDPVWAVKLIPEGKSQGVKFMDNLIVEFPKNLDVIFISYNEPNAEQNWQRVLKKAPYAKRVNGVKGIFNAHRAAAKLAKTDMFYAVDGDAYLANDWTFEFQPGIFDRNCSYVWRSKNPINGLTYEYGGVKLFSKKELLKVKKIETLDVFTGVAVRQKSMEQISCTTAFNTDEFSTWRSAFRECVKLYLNNKMLYVDTWLTKGKKKPFGAFAILGAQDGCKFAEEYANNTKKLMQINNYNWLREKFKNSTAT